MAIFPFQQQRFGLFTRRPCKRHAAAFAQLQPHLWHAAAARGTEREHFEASAATDNEIGCLRVIKWKKKGGGGEGSIRANHSSLGKLYLAANLCQSSDSNEITLWGQSIMNIVCRCVDPEPGPRHPLLGSVHFCGILYLFEIPSVWSTNTGACKRALNPFYTPSPSPHLHHAVPR